MSYSEVGKCPKCGAPIYHSTAWWSTEPPPVKYVCRCFPEPQVITTTTTNDTIKALQDNK